MPGQQLIWRNVNQFSDQVPEIRHDGHRVEIIRPLTRAEADAEVGPMFLVRCLHETDRDFEAFGEELMIQ